MIKPEKTLAVECVFNGKILKLDHELVQTQDGNKSFREIVHHDNSVAMLVIDNDNNVVLVNQWREAIQDFSLEIPAGKIDTRDFGVEINAVKRELNEELGMESNDIQFVHKFYTSTGFTDETIYIYIVKNASLVKDKLPRDKGEFLEIKKVPLGEYFMKIQRGEIVDGKSIMAGMYPTLIKMTDVINNEIN